MTTGERESYPSDGREVSTESSDIWSDLVPDVSAPETPLPSLEVDGDLGNVDRGETEIIRDSASERLRLVLDDFKGGGLNHHNLPDAIRQFLGGHDKSKAADFAVIFALASTLDDSGRGQLFSQAISSDYRIATPKSVSVVAGIISSNGREIDHSSSTAVYERLLSLLAGLGHLGENGRTEAEMLLRAFGVGRILSAGIRNNTSIDSGAIGNVDPEQQKLLALVKQLENTK